MTHWKKLLWVLPYMIFSGLSAQTLEGTVYGSEQEALVGANVYWLNSQKGAFTDENGYFKLRGFQAGRKLVVSYVGYLSDTLQVEENPVNIYLKPSLELAQIVVRDESGNLETISSELITTADLQKAACCNLSESFITNASVDIQNQGAVGGTKRLILLGLDGVYAQILREGIPNIRGLSVRNGLEYLPGTWIKSVDIQKGAGSVVHGYESITGQINTELAKPELSEKLLLNGYLNRQGRMELNVNTALPVSKKWSTGIMAHLSHLGRAVDRNDDQFRDIPEYWLLNFLNRWKYQGEHVRLQVGVQGIYENRWSGQVTYDRGEEALVQRQESYGFQTITKRLEGFAKIGFLSQNNPGNSLGIQLTGLHHEEDGFWGLRDYTGTQNHAYLNLIYQMELGGGAHMLKFGSSMLWDQYRETFQDDVSTRLRRNEWVPGVFTEYSWKPGYRFALVSGLRLDHHNLTGWMVNPRAHVKYDLSRNTIVRLSAGRGFRLANPIQENLGYLISARTLQVAETLYPERAWNYGISLDRRIELGPDRSGSFRMDFFRTDFQDRLITDLDSDPGSLQLYQLRGRSYAHSFQTSVEGEVLKNLNLTLAYKFYEVRASIGEEVRDVPFIPQHQVLFNVAYALPEDTWKFDATLNWIGAQRLPVPGSEALALGAPAESPDYWNLHAQITRTWGKWEIYLGGENLLNFRQSNPILDAQNPFGPNFDAGRVYGPVLGRMVYTGFRFTIPRS